LIIAVLGNPRIAKIKHQSQTGELLSDVGQNESKIKENNFPAGLDKVGGFIEAQGFNPISALQGREKRAISQSRPKRDRRAPGVTTRRR
jgi:hypothetical protein